MSVLESKSIKEIQLESQQEYLKELRSKKDVDQRMIRTVFSLINCLRREIEIDKSLKPKEIKKIPKNPETDRRKHRSMTALSGRLCKIPVSKLDVSSEVVVEQKLMIETCIGTRRHRHFINPDDLENVKLYIDKLLLKPKSYPLQWHFKCPADIDGHGCNKTSNILVFFDRLRRIGFNEKVESFINFITEKIYEKDHELVVSDKENFYYPTISYCKECKSYEILSKLKSKKPLMIELDSYYNNARFDGYFLTECSCSHKFCAGCGGNHSKGTKCVFENYWERYSEEEKSMFCEEIKMMNGQVCPNCRFFWAKDDNCDKVICDKCNTKFCFTCGEDLTNLGFNYLNHLISGPKFDKLIDGEEIQYRCTKTYIRLAAQYVKDGSNEDMFIFVIKSVMCSKIYIECINLFNSTHPLDCFDENQSAFVMICCLLGCIYQKKRIWLDVDTGILSSDNVDYSLIPGIKNRYNLLDIIDMFSSPNNYAVLNTYMTVKMNCIIERNLDIFEKVREIVKEI